MAPTSPKIVRTISSRHAAGSCRSSSFSNSISLELARRAGVFMGPLFLRPKRSLALGIWLIWLLYSVARVDGVATGDGLLGACDGVYARLRRSPEHYFLALHVGQALFSSLRRKERRLGGALGEDCGSGFLRTRAE